VDKAPERCILCGINERELLIEKKPWKVYRCPNCGLGFLDPRPSEEETEDSYQREYFSEQYDEGLVPGSVELEKRIKGERHRVKFIGSVKPGGQVLDVGCGYGYFLFACLKEKYHVMGLDVSEWASRYAAKVLGVSVKTGNMSDIDFPPRSFDVITMWHFLEHTRDPDRVMEKVRSWMKEDGILVVDVPNYEGTDARYMGEGWVGWQLPYHLWHFTYGSMAMLLRRHGLEIVKYKDYHSEVIKDKLSFTSLLRPFARLVAKWYSGTSFAVIASRNAV
jgi:ubiquinone/menaquinone biosynthesis C-methylase UbiE